MQGLWNDFSVHWILCSVFVLVSLFCGTCYEESIIGIVGVVRPRIGDFGSDVSVYERI